MLERGRPLAVYSRIDDLELAPGIAALEDAGFRVQVAGSDDVEVLAHVGADAVALLAGPIRIDEALLSRLPALQVVSLASQGHDNVDVDACARAGVVVSHLPALATEDVAVHAWALTLALVRQLPHYAVSARAAATWVDRPRFTPRRLSNLCIGIIGTGRTAAKYAALAGDSAARVSSWSRAGRALDGARPVAELNDLLTGSDVISLHLPLDADTEGLVDDSFLAAMRPGSYLVNVARGGLVDVSAVSRALDNGHLAGAAFDVLDKEPIVADHPFAERDQVLLTPHVAWLSAETEVSYALEQAANVISWQQTGAVNHLVSAVDAVRR